VMKAFITNLKINIILIKKKYFICCVRSQCVRPSALVSPSALVKLLCTSVFVLVLTALDLDVTKLSIHRKVLKVHWTGRGNSQPVNHKSLLSKHKR
jgi:hypothetical protein